MGPPYVVVECFATWLRTVVWKVGKVPKEEGSAAREISSRSV